MKRRYFTVVEMIVVIAIIGILAAIAVGVSSSIAKKRNNVTTKALIEKIEVGLEEFKREYGVYPSTVNPSNADPSFIDDTDYYDGNFEVDEIFPEGTKDSSNKKEAQKYELRKFFSKYVDLDEIRVCENGNIIDSFDNNIKYFSNGKRYILVSLGDKDKLCVKCATKNFGKAGDILDIMDCEECSVVIIGTE